jgi:magnesium chelatase subunit D
MLDASALVTELQRDPEPTVALLADMAVATDPALRAAARRTARRLLPPLGRIGTPSRHGTRRLVPRRGSPTGDVDLDRTLERAEGRRPDRADAIVSRTWGATPRAVCLLVDRSGSMTGRSVALAAVAAAAVVEAASDRLRTGVIAFAAEPLVLRDLGSEVPSDRVIDDLLSLRGHGTTDLAWALQAATAQLELVPPGGRAAILMSDCMHTRGADPLGPAGAFDALHVLLTRDDPDALSAAAALARRGHGRRLQATDLSGLASGLQTLLRG